MCDSTIIRMKHEYEALMLHETNADTIHMYYRRVLVLSGIMHNLPPERINKHIERADAQFKFKHGGTPHTESKA